MFSALLRLLCATSLVLFEMPIARAGHDLFTQLVVSESRETGLARMQSPVSIGIPLPASANIQSVSNLVTVGAVDTQYSALSYWPNGAIRWLLVDAIVDLPNDASSIALQLTNGQTAPFKDNLATETESEIQLNTGKQTFIIPKHGTGFLSAIETDGIRHTLDHPFAIIVGKRGSPLDNTSPWNVQVGKNGPVKACIEIESSMGDELNQVSLVIRLTAARYQTHLDIELVLIASPSNVDALTAPEIRLSAPSHPNSRSTDQTSTGMLSVLTQALADRIPSLFCDTKIRESQVNVNSESNQMIILAHPSQPLPPGSLHRTRFFLETKPGPDSPSLLGSPLIGRATSIETYNDGLAFFDKLLPAPEKPADDSTPQTEVEGAQTGPVFAYLKAINENYVQHFNPANEQVSAAWRKGIAADSSVPESLAVWPNLAGDRTLYSIYLEWAASYLERMRQSPHSSNQTETLVQLTRLLGTPLQRQAQPMIMPMLYDWLLPTKRGFEKRQEAAASLDTALLAALHHLTRRLADPTNNHMDGLYDLIEALLFKRRPEDREDRWFAIAYQLTGDPEILRQGQQWLDTKPDREAPNLKHLIAAPLRYSIWRPLSFQRIARQGSNLEIHWTVPPRAEAYRIKHAPSSITLSLIDHSPDFLPFHQANNAGEPKPKQSGRSQSMILALPQARQIQVEGRYLERGAALPAPDQAETSSQTAETTELSSTWKLSRSLLLIAALTSIIASTLMFWKRKQTTLLTPLLLTVAAGSFLACQPPTVEHDKEKKVTISKPSTEARSSQGTYRVHYTPNPDPIPLNEHFEIEVRVESNHGNTVPKRIEIRADMPAHGHGINTEPSIQDNGDGTYSVKGLLFHMKGDWELYVDIIDGPLRESAIFPITLE